jgi:hypothetical protein
MTILSKSELEALVEHQDGWCISLYMPTHRAGREIQQDPIRLKNLASKAEEQLIDAGLRAPEARDLLAPVAELAELDGFWRHQSDGLAVFRSPTLFRGYRLPIKLAELAIVSPRFHIKPLLPLLTADARFYLLALSQDQVRLLQGTRYSVCQVDLQGVPSSLAEVIGWEDPEKQLQWHTQTGSSKGVARAAMFHGHGYGTADDPKGEIKQFLRQVDDGLATILRGERAPLVLAGVNYVLDLYREVNSYGRIMDKDAEGSPEHLSEEELHERAWPIVEEVLEEERNEAVQEYEALAGTNSKLASDNLKDTILAAYQGRVDKLFVALNVQVWGAADLESGEVEQHEERQPGDEDLLDLAVEHTVLTDGVVYAIKAEEVPGRSPLAAVFRF